MVNLEEKEFILVDVDVSGETRDDHVASEFHRNQVAKFLQFQMGILQIEPCVTSCLATLNLNFVSNFSEDGGTQENIR